MSILFAGTNASRVKTSNTPMLSLIDTTQQFTLCAWVKQASFGANQAILGTLNFDSGSLVFYITTGGFPKFSFNGNNAVSNIAISANTWTHVAVTYNSYTDKVGHIYINGVEVTYSSQVKFSYPYSLYPSGSSFWIGGINGIGNNFSGSIAEVGIFNSALDALDILALASSTIGMFPNGPGWRSLLTYYHLNGQTNTEVDSTGNVANVGIPISTSYSADSPGYSFTAGQPVSSLVSAGVSVPATIDSGVKFTNPA